MKEWFDGKTVAVVGNARSLFDYQYGELIDSHETVCRINQGAIIVNNLSQGSKIDVFAFSGLKKFKNLLLELNLEKNIYTSSRKIVEASSLSNVMTYPSEYYKTLKNKLISLDKSFTATDDSPGIGEKGEIKKPSSGICLLDYISKMNPSNVSVFGFDWKKSPTYYNLGGYNLSHDWFYEEQYCINHFQKTLNFKFY